MTLKTLKDLYLPFAVDLALKQEAIKWVQAENTNNLIKNWIKHFFNITEDDLDANELGGEQ